MELDAKRTPAVAEQGRTERADESGREVARALTCALIGFDRLFREALGGMLQLSAGLRIVAHAADSTDGWEACLTARPDLVILDVAELGASVLAVADQLFALHPDSRAIVITSSKRSLQRSFWLPADRHAVVGREETFDLLLARVESLFASRLAEPTGRAPGGAARRPKPLTDREAQIMALLGEGLTTQEIATILQRSPHTIHTHRKRIAEKVGRLGSRISRRMASQRHANSHGAKFRG